MFVTRTKLQGQAQSAPALVGQERRIGSLAFVGFVVADCGRFLFAVDRQLSGVHVHHGVPEEAEPLEKFPAQVVVGCLEVAEIPGVESPKELPKRVAMRKIRQAQQVGEQAVELEGLGVFHATDPGHDGEKVREEKVRRVKLAVRVGGPAAVNLEEPAQAQRFAELLENDQAPVASQATAVVGKLDFSETKRHVSQTSLKVNFVKSLLYRR